MNLRLSVILSLLLLAAAATAQETPSPAGISFSGFVKTDMMLDSRQTVNLREGHFLLFPSPVLDDRAGADVNARANLNILSIQSRLAGKITGPDALGAKTGGLIEGEFFGTSDADVSGFRLRHAYLRMDWERSSLLVGQYWHPMFVAEMFPGVVSFNTGAPFQPFSRNPQIRFSLSVGDVRFIAAAMSQRDFQSSGPAGSSSSYLRNAVVPNLHAQVQYAAGGNVFGFGVDYKTVIPRLATQRNVATDASLGSAAVLGYAKIVLDPVTVKAEGVFGENLSDLMMIGGYAARTLDTASGAETYAALRTLSLWGEIATGREIEVALFAGYAKNLGASQNLVGALYGRGTDINRVLRIAPRFVWNSGKVRFSSELEYTSAAYGTPNLLNKGKVENAENVVNVRILFAAHYFF